MDDFREWLSDNLRYFMLGGGILLIVLILFFGIRACVSGRNGGSGGTGTEVSGNSQGTGGSGNTSSGTEGSQGISLTEADASVKTLIETYYKALGDADVAAIRNLETNLSPEDESQITSLKTYIDGYQVKEIYQIRGPKDGTFIVYAYFNYLCKDISTPAPALSSFYVVSDSNGSLKIDGTQDSQVDSYINSLQANADVAALVQKVTAARQSAEASDPALVQFLANLGEDGSNEQSSQVQEVSKKRANSDCNVRGSASTEGNILGTIGEGTEVTVLGTEGDWTKVNYNGQTGYIFSTLLDSI